MCHFQLYAMSNGGAKGAGGLIPRAPITLVSPLAIASSLNYEYTNLNLKIVGYLLKVSSD